MRRTVALVVLFAAALAAGSALSGTARAAYVFYFRTFGDWTVTCWLDEPTKRKSCVLQAPPAAVQTGGRSRVAVTEPAPERFTVPVQVRGTLPRAPLLDLRVDGNAPHRATPDRVGGTGWGGDAAAAIVAQMKAGKVLTLTVSDRDAKAPPRVEALSLVGFAPALSTYQAKLRAEGILPVR